MATGKCVIMASFYLRKMNEAYYNQHHDLMDTSKIDFLSSGPYSYRKCNGTHYIVKTGYIEVSPQYHSGKELCAWMKGWLDAKED